MKSAGRGRIDADGTRWQAVRTPYGVGTLAITPGRGEITARSWGPGARWLQTTVADLVGLDDKPSEFDPASGLVRDLHRRAPGLRLGRTKRPFATVVAAILGQRVTSREAKNGYRRLVERYGEDAPGPVPLRLAPSSERLAALRYEELHSLGVEKSRAQRLIEAARRAHRIDEIMGMGKVAAWQRLLAIRGIGPWTAAMVMGIAWGDRDAVPVGDYHLPNMVAWALAGEARADDDRMLELLEPYRGHRRRVLVLLKGAGIMAPKFGPKSAITAIEQI
ncbi:MAG: DNA-3-methyladenine glycosylase family protein [Acidimicrobiales bacterium]